MCDTSNMIMATPYSAARERRWREQLDRSSPMRDHVVVDERAVPTLAAAWRRAYLSEFLRLDHDL